MAQIRVSALAVADLYELIETHALPDSTVKRVRRALERLETFPQSGPRLHGRWEGLRFTLGPWRWMIVVYRYDEAEDLVTIAAFQDGRRSTAWTAG